MSLTIQIDSPPLRQEASGGIRVGQSRVLLELVIRAFQDGATAETIVQKYPSTTLADVYAVIAYYLRHKEDVDKYLVEREKQAERVRLKIENHQSDLGELRHRLAQRRTRG